jgi:hypothetical protein
MNTDYHGVTRYFGFTFATSCMWQFFLEDLRFTVIVRQAAEKIITIFFFQILLSKEKQ